MTIFDWIVVFIVFILGFAAGWYRRRAIAWEQAAKAAFSLLEAQKQLVEGVLQLNESMLQDRASLYQQQEREFIASTGVGRVH